MQIRVLRAWDVSAAQAVAIQQGLAGQVVRHNQFCAIHTVAGVDLSFPTRRTARAAVVVLSYPELGLLTTASAELPLTFPYIPGLLAFREAPAALAAFEKVMVEPDLVVCDRHGLAHPRRMGIACHLGLYLDKPVIGLAKSKLVGDYQMPGEKPGQWSELRDRGEVIGSVVRTRERVAPVFVSIGHRIDLPTAVDIILRCTRGYRLPEPSRLAHRAAGGARIS